ISVYSTSYAGNVIDRDYGDNVLVYEYIDHIDPKISGTPENIKILMDLKNFAFSGGADYIVASSALLYDEAVKAVGENKVIMAQNGVDTKHYRDVKHKEFTLPEEYKKFRNKYNYIVGYFGALAPWLWYDEINKLIAARPD